MQRRGLVVEQVYELEAMSLKVLCSSNHAVGIEVVSIAWVFLIDLEVANFCTVSAESPWKKLRKSCYRLTSKKQRLKSNNSYPKSHASHQTYTTAWEIANWALLLKSDQFHKILVSVVKEPMPLCKCRWEWNAGPIKECNLKWQWQSKDGRVRNTIE